jgi:sn-glycerol 3-phosphate transport system ATP-binding protein
MVFQNYALYPHMTVRQNLAYGLTNRRTPKDEIARRVAAAAEILEIGPYLDRKPRALSGGQRQRVAMGRAIVREPAAFLFDEPLSNLDAKLRVSMRGEIRQLQRRLGTTSIYVTHDQIEAMTLADRLVVLNGGRVEQIGRPIEVYRRPASTFVASFIGAPAMNLIRGTGEGAAVQVGATRIPVPGPVTGPVVLGIRPEDLVAAPAAGEAALSLRVDYVEELGAMRLVHGRIEGEPIACTWPSGEGMPEVVHLLPQPDAVHLFDCGTGQRLD